MLIASYRNKYIENCNWLVLYNICFLGMLQNYIQILSNIFLVSFYLLLEKVVFFLSLFANYLYYIYPTFLEVLRIESLTKINFSSFPRYINPLYFLSLLYLNVIKDFSKVLNLFGNFSSV